MRIAALILAVAVSGCALARTPHSDVVNPAVPREITFAGVTIDLAGNRDYRERFDRELSEMCYAHARSLLIIKRMPKMQSIILPILKRNGVPEDLFFLAVIESNLDPRITSSAKAAGLWQFMAATAKDYGLQVDDNVDERMDPWKSTEAACQYLLRAKDRYGDWETVAASYNAGMGRISRELAAQDVATAYQLWLPSETMRYIFRLLAAKQLYSNPRQYGFNVSADQCYQIIDYREIIVDTTVDDWVQWAKDNGTTYYELREHNPWIRSTTLPNPNGKSYIVRIPKD